MLGNLIAHLDDAELVASLLSTLDPDLLARIEVRAAAISMTPAEFACGAVREFIETGGDELWFQLLTLIRKADDPGLTAVRTILQWTVTAKRDR